jgi:hypothetical protein
MKIILTCALVVATLFSGCSKIKVENPTNDFHRPERLVKLKNKKLGEISGIAASANNPGYFWVHNDSGNAAEVYLVDEKLNILLTCSLEMENRDWEDIAVGPGPEDGVNYIYVGEIGDNTANYEYKHIYRFEEPRFDGKLRHHVLSSVDTITFRLEDRKKDTETLLIDPVNGNLYVISKREKPVWLYELKYPQSTTDTLTARKVMSLPFTQIVGGDFSPDGKQLLLKNYEHIYYWTADSYKPLEDLLSGEHFEVPYELEPQGEAIGWARDKSGFYTISEKNTGKDTYLYYYKAVK